MIRDRSNDVPWAKAAERYLVSVDSDMARAWTEIGPPPPRSSPASFATLLNVIISQQISKQAASAIAKKLREKMQGSRPEHLLALSTQQLKAAGLSRAKILYARDLAEALVEKRVKIASLSRLEDEEAIKTLCSIKGIGRWSAEVFLLFAIKRPDIMPAADLALMVAAGRLKRLKTRPTPKDLRKIAEPWRPYRSYAARFLWHYYRSAPL